jgi:hypothetical protein
MGAPLQQCLQLLAQLPGTSSISLVLSPDPQHLNHPSASLQIEQRDLHELRQNQPFKLTTDPGLLIRWQA